MRLDRVKGAMPGRPSYGLLAFAAGATLMFVLLAIHAFFDDDTVAKTMLWTAGAAICAAAVQSQVRNVRAWRARPHLAPLVDAYHAAAAALVLDATYVSRTEHGTVGLQRRQQGPAGVRALLYRTAINDIRQVWASASSGGVGTGVADVYIQLGQGRVFWIPEPLVVRCDATGNLVDASGPVPPFRQRWSNAVTAAGSGAMDVDEATLKVLIEQIRAAKPITDVDPDTL